MIRFMDSFSHYDLDPNTGSNLFAKWTTITDNHWNLAILPGSGRCLQKCLQVGQNGGITGYGPIWHVPNTSQTEGVMGTGFRYTSVASAAAGHVIFSVLLNGAQNQMRQCEVIILSNGTVALVRGNSFDGETIVATSGIALQANSWHFLEWVFNAKSAGGGADLWLDGTNHLLTFSGDMAVLGSDGYTDIQLGICRGSGEGALQFSDFYYGDAMADRKGDVRIYARLPNRDGTHRDWAPKSGTIHFNQVNDNPPDGDITYNFDRTVGDRDTYGFPAIGIPSGTVYAVQICPMFKKDDVGARSAAVTSRVGGVDYDGTSQVIADGTYLYYPQVYDLNDPSGVPWTVASAVNSEFGAVLTA